MPLSIRYRSWAEVHSNGARWQAGVFGGYARNLGSRRTLTGPSYGRGGNIREVFRISPRLVHNAGKLRLAAEAELTSAAYGAPDARRKVGAATWATNVRFLLATYYFF